MNEEPIVTKRCSACGEHKPVAEYHKSKRDGLQHQCKGCSAEAHRARVATNPYRHIFNVKKHHAKRLGIPFDIRLEELVWNDYCPVLGIKLSYTRFASGRTGPKPDSPSFDRVDPTKGYVRGNVIIVSNRANSIKSNATVEELKKVAAFYEQLIPQSQHGDFNA